MQLKIVIDDYQFLLEGTLMDSQSEEFVKAWIGAREVEGRYIVQADSLYPKFGFETNKINERISLKLLAAIKKQIEKKKWWSNFEESFLNSAIAYCEYLLKKKQSYEDFVTLYQYLKKEAFYELGLLRYDTDVFHNSEWYGLLTTMLSEEEIWERLSASNSAEIAEQTINVWEWNRPKIATDVRVKVSVVIPIYNVEAYLQECLDSVINQTLKEIEIICVNDGSTDSCGDIIKEYSEKESRIILVEKENGGLSSARNAGLEKVTGEYTIFLDSDDYLDEKALEYLYYEAKKDNLDQLYYTASVFYDECEEEVYTISYKRRGQYSGITTGAELFVNMMSKWDFKPMACLYISQTTFLQEHKLSFLEGVIHEDNLFTIQCMFFADRTRYANAELYKRRIRKDSIMTAGQNFKHAYHYYKILKELEKFCGIYRVDERPEFYQAVVKYISNMAVSAGNYLLAMDSETLEEKLATIEVTERMDFYARTYLYARERRDHRRNADVVKDLWGRMRIKAAREESIQHRMALQKKKNQNPEKIVWLIGTPEYGNLGDHMISEMELELIRDVYSEYKINEITITEYWDKKKWLEEQVKTEDILLFHGGGNVGNLWPRSEYIRRDAFATWKRQKKIIMPQSICFTDDEEGLVELQATKEAYRVKNLVLACRDKKSYKFAKRELPCTSVLVPDIALYCKVEKQKRYTREKNKVLLCLRNDKEQILSEEKSNYVENVLKKYFKNIERIDTVIASQTKATRKTALMQFFEKLNTASVVITDRLHGMIFCAILGIPCIALDNTYGKISGGYAWIRELDYIHFVQNVEDMEKVLKNMKKKKQAYPYQEYRKKFVPLIKKMKN